METKLCKICRVVKPLDEFPIYCAGGRSGYRGECRRCNNTKWYPVRQAHNRRYYDENTNGYADCAKEKARAAYANDKAAQYERNRRYENRHPERVAAKRAVMVAVRSGTLVPMPCEICGGVAEAHHDDYACPLDVRWLCRQHHAAHHRALRRKQSSGLRPGVPLLIGGREVKGFPRSWPRGAT